MRGAKLVAICDNDRPKARALADRFDISDVYTDIEDLLEGDGLQAIVIATPNHAFPPAPDALALAAVVVDRIREVTPERVASLGGAQ